MKVSYTWLGTYFDAKLPPVDTLADLFTFHSFEIEGIEHRNPDSIIDAKILPDRAHYCLSHKGVADEVSFLTKIPVKERYASESIGTLHDEPEVRIDAPTFCRRYVARYIELPPFSMSPRWLEDSLVSIDQRVINTVVDSTNYTMFDIGQPLHAFDAEKVRGVIVVRAAKDGEMITLLDGREVLLTTNDHVIADNDGPLAIAGVKGGKRAEVTTSTRKIVLESANFNPSSVRVTANRLNLRNESSRRFENEITPELAIHGMHNFCELIKDILPETKYGPIVDVYPTKIQRAEISITPAFISGCLGIDIPESDIREILHAMKILVDTTTKNWKLTIPFERLDLVIAEDIVEEVGRIYGYDKIKGLLPPKHQTPPAVLPLYYLSEKVKNILVEQGFSEVSLYTLVAKGEIETAHPLAKDKSFARKNLLDGMMVALEKNALNAELLGLETIKIFEIGRSFTKDSEKTILAIGVAQVKKIKGITADQYIKDACQSLEKELEIDIIAPGSLSKGAHTVITIDLDEIGKTYKPGVSYDDLGFGIACENRFEKYSQYPFMVRDIAVFVSEGVSSDVVWSEIRKGIDDASAGVLLVRSGLFDSFKKDGKMSYAFRLVFQSMDRTLTDDEANGIMQKIYDRMKAQDWQVR